MSKILVPLDEVIEIAKRHTMRPEMFIKGLKEKYKETPYKYPTIKDFIETRKDDISACEFFDAARELKDE